MAPKQTERRTQRRRRPREAPPQPPRTQARSRDSAVLLDVIDELGLVIESLDGVELLSHAERLVGDDSSDAAIDPIGHRLRVLGGRPHLDVSEDDGIRDIIGSPDALIAVARWRIARLRTLVETLVRRGRSGREGR